MSFTEETLKRFYAKEIRCPFCGCMISKKEMPYYYKNDKEDIIRKWNCSVCSAYYSENITELQKRGII